MSREGRDDDSTMVLQCRRSWLERELYLGTQFYGKSSFKLFRDNGGARIALGILGILQLETYTCWRVICLRFRQFSLQVLFSLSTRRFWYSCKNPLTTSHLFPSFITLTFLTLHEHQCYPLLHPTSAPPIFQSYNRNRCNLSIWHVPRVTPFIT